MGALHHILVAVVLYLVTIVTVCCSVCLRCHSRRDQHLQRTQSFVFSVVAMYLICLAVVCLFANDGLNTASLWYSQIMSFTNSISNKFPTIWKLLLTLIGLFTTFALLRPNIEIGQIMVYIPKSKRVLVHVRNCGLFSVYNVSAKLYFVDETGENKVVKSVELEDNNQDKLEWCFAHSNQKDVEFATKPKNADVMAGLKKVADDGHFFEIRVTADHAISRERRTIIQQFTKNNILVGMYHNGHFKKIETVNPFVLKEYYTKQSIMDLIHKLFLVVEFIVSLLIIFLFACHIGNTEIITESYLVFDILIFSFFILEIIRIWSRIPLKVAFDDSISYINHINQ